MRLLSILAYLVCNGRALFDLDPKSDKFTQLQYARPNPAGNPTPSVRIYEVVLRTARRSADENL
jgi:hypothetical protein